MSAHVSNFRKEKGDIPTLVLLDMYVRLRKDPPKYPCQRSDFHAHVLWKRRIKSKEGSDEVVLGVDGANVETCTEH